MSHLERTIKDLVIFYIKENYNKYLVDSNSTSIDIKDLKAKVSELYYPNKTELKEFVKKCMKEMTKDSPEEYPGDLVINNIFFDIYQDDELNINRIYNEIKLFQENNNNT
jgi:hypothetical protein|tara:strand:+ start:2681 stop:3010 length:330 start_codon:yes stop_codon:yes gene_type:complete